MVHALGPRTHRHVRCGAPTSQGDAGLGDGLALFVLPELRAHAARDVSLEERKGGRREGVKVRRRRRKITVATRMRMSLTTISKKATIIVRY